MRTRTWVSSKIVSITSISQREFKLLLRLTPHSCHYTTNSDLYCAADMGFLLVVRNYREVFRLADYHAILEVLDQQSLWLFYEKPICDLTTFGTKVVFSDVRRHVRFWLSTLGLICRGSTIIITWILPRCPQCR